MSRKAFTLVELLVVISIIAIISTIAIVSLGSARKQARNVRRIADIKQLATAFSLGLDASSAGTYPSSGGNVWVCVSSTCYGAYSSFIASGTVDAFFTPYIAKPTDPAESSRGYGGYLYNGAFAGGGGYDGTFIAGPYIDFILEPTTSCGLGRIWQKTANSTECLYNLIQ